MVVSILKDAFERRYHANICSFSFLIFLFILALTLILPFILAVSTGSLWSKSGSFYIQPDVEFTGAFLATSIHRNSETNGLPIVQSYSTLNKINSLISPENSMTPTYSTSSSDNNLDGLEDNIRFEIGIPGDPLNLENVKLILEFTYKIDDISKLSMKTGVYLDLQAGEGGAARMEVDGVMEFRQISLLSVGITTRKVYENSILEEVGTGDYAECWKANVLRNESVELVGETIRLPFGGDSLSTVGVNIRIPPYQEFVYQPPLLETLKFAWVQYFSILFPFYIILFTFYCFLLKYQILDTYISSNLPHTSIHPQF